MQSHTEASADFGDTATITDQQRAALVRAAVLELSREQINEALSTLSAAHRPQMSVAMANAVNSLRRHRTPETVIGKAQYRAALPFIAAAAADACLAKTIELLGADADDPTREQLAVAIEKVSGSFDASVVGVMLASVAEGDMPASDLCFVMAATEERFGLTGVKTTSASGAEEAREGRTEADNERRIGPTPEQRLARRQKKQKEVEERRKSLDAKRKASEQLRRVRKQDRSGGGRPEATSQKREARNWDSQAAHDGQNDVDAGYTARAGQRDIQSGTRRQPALTPVQREEFDAGDPWVGAVIFAWIPFDASPSVPGGTDGKSRRCVVVAGSPTDLLVRPGYSEGGVKSRDWKSVVVRSWSAARFDQPTWIDAQVHRVERDPESSPVGWLTDEDWNALW